MIQALRQPGVFITTLFLCTVFSPVSAQQGGAGMVELSQQLTRLEAEVRQLRGEVERLTYENNRLKSQQNDYYVDLDGRIRKLESGQLPGSIVPGAATQATTSTPVPVTTQRPAGLASPQVPSVPVVPGRQPGIQTPVTISSVPQPAMPVAPADPALEKSTYKDAFDLLKLGKYQDAIPSFKQFLAQYPTGSYASNAQYWLGEAHYVTREFEQAIEEFNKVITLYPQSRKVPDAMLKIGYIYYELNDSNAARQSLNDLIDKFPSTTAARLAGNRLQRMKLEGR